MGNVDIVSPIIQSEVLGTPRRSFQQYHPSTFVSAAMQNLRRHLIFSCVLKTWQDWSYRGRLKGKILEFVHIIEWTSFEPWCIYNHRMTKKNVNQWYLWTEYSVCFHRNSMASASIDKLLDTLYTSADCKTNW